MSDANPVQVLDADNFMDLVLDAPKPFLVDFSASSSEPCQKMVPLVDELVGELSERIEAGRVDIDGDAYLAAAYDIQATPTFVLFEDGLELDRKVGTGTKDELRTWVESTIDAA